MSLFQNGGRYGDSKGMAVWAVHLLCDWLRTLSFSDGAVEGPEQNDFIPLITSGKNGMAPITFPV